MPAIFLSAAPYADDAMNLPVHDVAGAIPFYESVLGFRVESRTDAPRRSAVLARDRIRIGLCENGGDPSQEGCCGLCYCIGQRQAGGAGERGARP